MSATRKTSRATKPPTVAKASSPSVLQIPAIQIPLLSSLFPVAPAPTTHTGDCDCECCCRTSTTVCLTFDTTWLQNLVNMFPKVKITNQNSCSEDQGEDETGPGT